MSENHLRYVRGMRILGRLDDGEFFDWKRSTRAVISFSCRGFSDLRDSEESPVEICGRESHVDMELPAAGASRTSRILTYSRHRQAGAV